MTDAGPGAPFEAVDHALMARALRLAEKGLWTTEPNPRVGCILAHGERIVGSGWHRRAGGPHAEIAALSEAGADARGSTAYVTLEPCSHHGRTPPCADALIEAGVRRVVCAVRDPHPAVAGTGLERLRAAGVEVASGLMADAARALNPGFLSRHERGRPWFRAKLAGSLDGRSVGPDGASKWITGPEARRDGHRWRARAGAILTGIDTVLADDPSLDVRLESHRAALPVVVVDSRGRLPAGARVLRTGARVIQASLPGAASPPAGCERIETGDDGAGRIDLQALAATLAAYEFNEVHVEGGAVLTGALLAAGLVDELLLYQATCLIGADGGPLVRLPGVEKLEHRLQFEVLDQCKIGPDTRLRLRPDGGR
jgi:diaminohydroxyphosphoribosylaminopyrimidine deaminase/5-amino-6-(5-phosphoribosylamino)uracil reductase